MNQQNIICVTSKLLHNGYYFYLFLIQIYYRNCIQFYIIFSKKISRKKNHQNRATRRIIIVVSRQFQRTIIPPSLSNYRMTL